MTIFWDVLHLEKRNNHLGSIWTIILSHTLGAGRLIRHYSFFFSFLLICSYSSERPNLQTFYQEAPKGYAKASPPDQWTQVHGHIPEAAHLLLSLQGVYLVRGSLPCLLEEFPCNRGFLWLCVMISGESMIIKTCFRIWFLPLILICWTDIFNPPWNKKIVKSLQIQVCFGKGVNESWTGQKALTERLSQTINNMLLRRTEISTVLYWEGMNHMRSSGN